MTTYPSGTSFNERKNKMATSPIKIRVFVQEDVNYANHGLGKHYSVTRMIFDRKTGLCVDHGIVGTGYTFKNAHELKRQILEEYKC